MTQGSSLWTLIIMPGCTEWDLWNLECVRLLASVSMVLPLHSSFFFFFPIIVHSFLSFLLPMVGMKQKFISNLPVLRVGAFLWYKAKGLCISDHLISFYSGVYNENINWWVFCKTWVLASAFSLGAINCLASLNLPQTNFYIKNRNLKTCTPRRMDAAWIQESDSICNFFFPFSPCIVFLNWWVIALQCHVGVCHQQCESAVSIHVSPLSRASVPAPTPFQPCIYDFFHASFTSYLDKLAHLYASFCSLFHFGGW